MSADLARLAAVAHYVIARTEPAKLGATKLNKILWYADLEHYRRTGKSLTGVGGYVRMPRGPVPQHIEDALWLLRREGRVAERRTQVYNFERREFVWLKEPDLSGFTADEIDGLNVYIEVIKDMTADQISNITHDDELWKELSNGELMPVGAGSVVPRVPDQRELAWAQSLEAV